MNAGAVGHPLLSAVLVVEASRALLDLALSLSLTEAKKSRECGDRELSELAHWKSWG